MKYAGLIVFCIVGLIACHPAEPETKQIPSAATATQPTPVRDTGSRDQSFQRMAEELAKKNPEQDAQQAIQQDDRHFLCNAGRSLSVPGIDAEIFQQVRGNCPTRCLEGVTDVRYGAYHRQYLEVALEYSARWNQTMLPACRTK